MALSELCFCPSLRPPFFGVDLSALLHLATVDGVVRRLYGNRLSVPVLALRGSRYTEY